jgi:hypothetical protein
MNTPTNTVVADALIDAAGHITDPEDQVQCSEEGRVEEYEVKTEIIEDVVSSFGDVENLSENSYKPFLFGALAWSYKFKLARSVIRLLDQNAGMADALKREQTKRIDALAPIIVRTESQIEELSNMYKWAATQTKPDLVPEDEDVMSKLQVQAATTKDDVVEYAEMMGVSIEQATEDLDGVEDTDTERAMKYGDEALTELKRLTEGQPEEFIFTGWNAVSTIEKIAEKAEVYAERSKGLFKNNRRKSKKAHLVANIKAFEAIMNTADELAVTWRRDVETEMQKAEELDTAVHEGSTPILA